MNTQISFKKSFAEKKVLKIISGINNFDVKKVFNIVNTAEFSSATYIDVSANINLIKLIKKVSKLPICVSVIDSSNIYKCLANGAEIIEIGNYDLFYKHGHIFSSKRIINLVKEIKILFPQITLCVTLPHDLSVKKQLILAKQLMQLGVNLFQTEGLSSHVSYSNNIYSIGKSLSKVSATLSTTYILSDKSSIPIVTASGLTQTTIPMAFAYGASGIGISQSLLKMKNLNEMNALTNTVKKIISNTSCHNIDYSHQQICLSPGFKSLIINKILSHSK
uniref:hypothetical protein n=1 Tax=Goniotrichopsis reniformis TaxID=468933 RepID=UPI001FCD7963|nr:hypothetical protein MW428_pgp142 [Goniotrichopsis reniformis]UNJ14756.1 hypothetical protein [Goniotrichopsis reniformis]